MRHTFLIPHQQRPIAVGELVRSDASPGLINIVLEIVKINGKTLMRSVRYGKVNNGDFLKLAGKRSRWVDITDKWNWWEVVEEYVPLDNADLKAYILNSMKGVDTTWRPPEVDEDEEVHSDSGE
jgi:hypothetical protein